jgi:hypothetical protein
MADHVNAAHGTGPDLKDIPVRRAASGFLVTLPTRPWAPPVAGEPGYARTALGPAASKTRPFATIFSSLRFDGAFFAIRAKGFECDPIHDGAASGMFTPIETIVSVILGGQSGPARRFGPPNTH